VHQLAFTIERNLRKQQRSLHRAYSVLNGHIVVYIHYMEQDPQASQENDDAQQLSEEELDNLAGGGRATQDTCTQQGCM
jgi:hypothetical protein